MDPNSNPTYQRASDEAIAALLKKQFGGVEGDGKDSSCAVCGIVYGHESTVVELPCHHLFCDEGCIEQWLKTSRTCPTCRYKLPEHEGSAVSAAERQPEQMDIATPNVDMQNIAVETVMEDEEVVW
jgi:hypothetical protein